MNNETKKEDSFKSFMNKNVWFILGIILLITIIGFAIDFYDNAEVKEKECHEYAQKHKRAEKEYKYYTRPEVTYEEAYQKCMVNYPNQGK